MDNLITITEFLEVMEVQDISRLSLKWFQGLCLRKIQKMIFGRTKRNGFLRVGISMITMELLEDGTEFYMLAERRYPLTKETLERMLSLRLIAKSESEAVFYLLRFIQKQIDESGSHDGSEKDL
ncbi:hypothetical protein Tco_1101256 [Tanacetum coccineum]